MDMSILLEIVVFLSGPGRGCRSTPGEPAAFVRYATAERVLPKKVAARRICCPGLTDIDRFRSAGIVVGMLKRPMDVGWIFGITGRTRQFDTQVPSICSPFRNYVVFQDALRARCRHNRKLTKPTCLGRYKPKFRPAIRMSGAVLGASAASVGWPRATIVRT